MRYYICITPFFPTKESFVGPYVLDQVKAIMRNSNLDVIVFKPAPFYKKAEDYEYDGVKVYRFKNYVFPSNLWPNSVSDRLSVRALMHKLKEINVDLKQVVACHCHVASLGMFANALKRINPKIISIVQHHGFDVFSVTDGRLANYDFHKKRCISYSTRICNDADINVGVSNKTLDYVRSCPKVKLKNTYVLYNGVEKSKFSPSQHPKQPNKNFIIGCVANFWALKDQITLLKALKQLVDRGRKNIKIIFVGFGYTRTDCEEYVKNNDLSEYVQFVDSMRHEELVSFYRSLDLFVLPSYWEAFGCVYTEAYACGVPFIAVKGQGISELVPDTEKSRWLIEKSDHNQLAKLIERTMVHPEEKQRLSIPVDSDSLISDFLTYLQILG